MDLSYAGSIWPVIDWINVCYIYGHWPKYSFSQTRRGSCKYNNQNTPINSRVAHLFIILQFCVLFCYVLCLVSNVACCLFAFSILYCPFKSVKSLGVSGWTLLAVAMQISFNLLVTSISDPLALLAWTKTSGRRSAIGAENSNVYL
jgi:hypothetical protein